MITVTRKGKEFHYTTFEWFAAWFAVFALGVLFGVLIF